MKALHVTSGSIGGLSMLFIAIAILAPAWVIIECNLVDLHFKAQIGIFISRVCVKESPSVDYTCSYGKNEKMFEAFDRIESSDVALAEILCMSIGAAGCIGALIISLQLRKETLTQSSLIACSIFWAGTAILVFIAVGLQGYKNQQLTSRIRSANAAITDDIRDELSYLGIKIDFPWAVLLAGFGAFCAFSNAFLTAILCGKNSNRDPVPVVGQWHQFQNVMVVQQ